MKPAFKAIAIVVVCIGLAIALGLQQSSSSGDPCERSWKSHRQYFLDSNPQYDQSNPDDVAQAHQDYVDTCTIGNN